MLAKEWNKRKQRYDFLIVGSGYGGAITAARISAATPKRSVCLLERGREYPVGDFPDKPTEVFAALRNPVLNPLGLYDFLTFPEISVLKGSGLGGTSLINANVAIVPDQEVFEQVAWPRGLKLADLVPFYAEAKRMLAARPHPRSDPDHADCLLKVKALDRRARETGRRAFGLDLAVNFDIDGPNAHGVNQKPCIDCGDCVTGCNVGAKNTLYMNYLPIAYNNQTDIFTQTQADWIESLSSGGWRVHGKRYPRFGFPENFAIEAGHIILSAGSLGSAEILLRSERNGLSLSPRVGAGFSGNGDFFGVAYNADEQINSMGFGNKPDHSWRKKGNAPGPSIVGAIRYDSSLPIDKRIAIEDFSFPSASLRAVMTAFGTVASLGGAEDTDIGDEMQESERRRHDNIFDMYQDHNAVNHTLLYLVMGHDDAKGTLHLKKHFLEETERVEIDWDDAGRQPLFTTINEELRRHARSLGASFLPNPLWNFVALRNLITAHPLGGCPMGEDYMDGAVDEFGRVFSGDGSLHQGLFVADGSLIPSALGVNPFMTISALSERIADRIVRYIGGEAFPARSPSISVPGPDPLEVLTYKEADLERIFTRVETKGIDLMINSGVHTVNVADGVVRNDTVWKGFFPKGHVLNQISTAFFAGFKKRFSRTLEGVVGLTSDSDGRINAVNTLEEVTIAMRTGTLEPGKYILLRYTEPQWSGFYDIFKVISDDLLIGRVYLGQYPNGIRLFTFPMTRTYGLDNMTVPDHQSLYQNAPAPTKEQLSGLWEMRMVANANNTGTVAYLNFDLKPDGRLEARYQFLGLLEGLSEPVFGQDHFQLNDFTPFHDEIRFVSDDFLVGKYTTASPPGLLHLFGPNSLGVFHLETLPGGTTQFSFFYTLRRSKLGQIPAVGFLQPLLDIRLPDGVGMTFDEEMVGHFSPELISTPGREGDLKIEAQLKVPPQLAAAQTCSFQVRMVIRNLNDFVNSPEHEAQLKGTIHFSDFAGQGPDTFEVIEEKSLFNYLRINPETQEAEMLYRLYFRDTRGKEYFFHGRKYMQKDQRGGIVGAREILYDYTTLYCHLSETASEKQLGSGLLKFRTFEDAEAVGSFVNFLGSFQVTGTDNLFLKAQGQLRFLAFTNQFVLREYDPLTVQGGFTADEVREAVLRGAEAPHDFSTRPTDELQAILRESETLPPVTLLNHGAVKIDYEKRRIWRDSFWKGSFAKDTLMGWEERIRSSGLTGAEADAPARYIGGSFWEQFSTFENDQIEGHVVNSELNFLPGKPIVKQVKYPDSNRKYAKAGDDVLLLTYSNDPYRKVYDIIKVIDEDNCIGVMHLGDYPTGMEFSTFVMARHNYPFEKMSVPDHNTIFGGDRVHVPSPAEIAGEWHGHVVFLTRPDLSLMNQLNPVAFRLRFIPTASGVDGRFRFGLLSGQMQVEFTDEFVRLVDFTSLHDEIRMIDRDTIIGKWVSPSSTMWLRNAVLQKALRGYLEPGQDRLAFYYILKRA